MCVSYHKTSKFGILWLLYIYLLYVLFNSGNTRQQKIEDEQQGERAVRMQEIDIADIKITTGTGFHAHKY